jgi:hypothetical protein
MALGGSQRDAQPQASRSAAILHALLQVEGHHFPNRAALRDEPVEQRRHRAVPRAFGRSDEEHSSLRPCDQLTVEEISRHRALEGELALAHDERREFGSDALRQALEHRLLVDIRPLVAEEHGAVA